MLKDLVRQKRIKLGMGVIEFAKKFNVACSCIHALEGGERKTIPFSMKEFIGKKI